VREERKSEPVRRRSRLLVRFFCVSASHRTDGADQRRNMIIHPNSLTSSGRPTVYSTFSFQLRRDLSHQTDQSVRRASVAQRNPLPLSSLQ